MTTNRFDQRSEQLARGTDPASQSRAIKLNAFPRIDLRLSVQRNMVGILRCQNMRQQGGLGETALDRTRRCNRLHDLIASCTAHLDAYMANDLERLGDPLQILGDLFAKLAQLTTAIGAAVLNRSMRDHFAWKVFGKRLANWLVLDRLIGSDLIRDLISDLVCGLVGL